MTTLLAILTIVPTTTIMLALAIATLATILHLCHLCPSEPVTTTTTTTTTGYCAETLQIIADVLDRCAAPLATFGGEVKDAGFGLPSPCLWDAPAMMTAADAHRSDEIDSMAHPAWSASMADTGCMDTIAMPVDYVAAGRFIAARRSGRADAWAGAGPTPVALPCPC